MVPAVTTHLERCGEFVARLTWENLTPEAQHRTQLIILDTLGCAVAASQRSAHGSWADAQVCAGGPAEATVWTRHARLAAPQAALVNGTVTHHLELDDGTPRASIHGGVTIVPAALACAEVARCSGRDFLTAVAAGYSVAVACGRPLLPGLGAHRLHPPAFNGVFGAAAAAARVLGHSASGITTAVGLAGLVAPMAPFESFTRGAPVKDLYAGWPAFIGVTAARLAESGLTGPAGLFESPEDGLSSFLNHGPPSLLEPPDPEEVLSTRFKPFATCRSVQPTLTALEELLPIDARAVIAIEVSTYPFAVSLSQESDPTTAIGAKLSIPYCVASLVLDGEVGADAFSLERLVEPERRALADRVHVSVAAEMVEPLVRGSHVTLRLRDGTVRRAATTASRWSQERPASERELRDKFRTLTGGRATTLETAVHRLPAASDVDPIIAALAALGENRT